MSYDDIVMLKETLQIIEQGCYEHEGEEVKLKLSDNEKSEAQVYLPDRIAEICAGRDADPAVENECVYDCVNMDSYTYARKMYAEQKKEDRITKTEILVLNFANPVNPGGGVRTGARAQRKIFAERVRFFFPLRAGRHRSITDITGRCSPIWDLTQ